MSDNEEILDCVYARFLQSVNKFGDKPFLHIPRQATKSYTNGPVDFSYKEMAAAVDGIRTVYKQAGYQHGHRIALLLENRAEFFQHFLALNGLGVCVVPTNPDYVVDEISYLLDNSDVSLVIGLPSYLDKLTLALESIERQVDNRSINALTDLPLAPVIDTNNIVKGELADVAIVYTSGTTGKPKGCVLSNEFFFCVGDWYMNIGGLCHIEPGCDRLITPLPVFHTNALVWSMMAMMQSGGCIIQLDRFHSSTWWETLRESEATILHYLGVMPAMLLNLPESEHDFNDQIRFALGAGVEPDRHQHFEQRFGFPLIEGWAMTETGSGVCFMSEKEPRHVGTRCMGQLTEDMEFRIVDDLGEDVVIGEPGELIVRRKGKRKNYGFFSEYYKNPEATDEAWKGDWFRSGDIVKQDEEGSAFFIERKKNIIRRSGENIAAAEVESILMEHQAILNCAVAPVPDPIREEEVAACVILDTTYAKNKDMATEFVEYCLEKLSYFKVPGYIIFVESSPITSTQKVQRSDLRNLCLELVDSVECIDCRPLKKKTKKTN